MRGVVGATGALVSLEYSGEIKVIEAAPAFAAVNFPTVLFSIAVSVAELLKNPKRILCSVTFEAFTKYHLSITCAVPPLDPSASVIVAVSPSSK